MMLGVLKSRVSMEMSFLFTCCDSDLQHFTTAEPVSYGTSTTSPLDLQLSADKEKETNIHLSHVLWFLFVQGTGISQTDRDRGEAAQTVGLSNETLTGS